MQLLCNC
uniref:Uncharacterized protein n=1 Tax=Oryza nivara TaxID=4536 RepID=A0A1Y8Z5J3_ORYNI